MNYVACIVNRCHSRKCRSRWLQVVMVMDVFMVGMTTIMGYLIITVKALCLFFGSQLSIVLLLCPSFEPLCVLMLRTSNYMSVVCVCMRGNKRKCVCHISVCHLWSASWWKKQEVGKNEFSPSVLCAFISSQSATNIPVCLCVCVFQSGTDTHRDTHPADVQ